MQKKIFYFFWYISIVCSRRFFLPKKINIYRDRDKQTETEAHAERKKKKNRETGRQAERERQGDRAP